MTTLGLVLFILLIILTVTSLFFTYKYITSIFNSKYFLFFVIFGSLIISTLFLVPKTSSALISSDEINISDEINNLEASRNHYEELKNNTSKDRIKKLKNERKIVKKDIKKNSDETKQQKLDAIQTELDAIPNIKIEIKALKKNIKKQLRIVRWHKFSIFMRNNAFVIFICAECLSCILFILFIIGTIKKPAMLEAYEQYCKKIEEENARKKEENERRKEEKRIEEERKRQEKIIEIAKYFERNNIKFLDVQNACLFIKEYDETIKSYNKIISNCSKIMGISAIDSADSIPDFFQAIGEKRNAKNEYYNTREKLETFESQNKGQYLQLKAFLSAMPDKTPEFCDKYGSEIINTINELHGKKEQEKKKALEQERRQNEAEKEQVENNAKKREEGIYNDIQIEKLSTEIDNLNDKINILQLNFSKNKRLESSTLNFIGQNIDRIAEFKEYLSQKYNEIVECKNKLEEIYEKCENKDENQKVFETIKNKFDNILIK